MKTPEELRAFYDGTLRPQLEALEQRRQRAVHGSSLAVAALVIGGLVVGAMLASSGGPILMIIPVVVGMIIGAGVFKLSTAGYCREFKNTIVRGVIEFLEPGLRYEPERGITQEMFRAADLFQQRIDRYQCEDLVEGRLGQTEIAFSEVHAEYKTTSRNGKTTQTHWHTIFKGLFFIGDFHKDFHGRMVVLPDTAEKFLGGLGQTLQAMNPSRQLLIKLEDPEFEREFVVYGTDQIEARYLLSPSMMERITAFRRKQGGDVFLAFVGSRVVVAVSTKENLFEPRLFGATDFQTLLTYAAQLSLATDIVEDLNLNTRIWSKT